MTPAEILDQDIAATAQTLRDRGEPFAIATVIRTLGATAAKPGAKALLTADGTIAQGWVGGGCVRGALRRATERALAEGQPQFISLQPEDLLVDQGLEPGADKDGVRYARNGCPSKGSMDLFVEPILPLPELAIIGASPVAKSLADLAGTFQWAVRAIDPSAGLEPLAPGARRMIVVATQGAGDAEGLKTALSAQAEHISFVGSRRKFATLRDRLVDEGLRPQDLDAVGAPAGLSINAVTPEEIALSILAELTQLRRAEQRSGSAS